MTKLKHVKLFENYVEGESFNDYAKRTQAPEPEPREKFLEDTCQQGEKVIIYRMEDFMAYGIVSDADAARISAAVNQLRKTLTASGDKYHSLDLMNYDQLGPGTCFFILDSNGDITGYSKEPDASEFDYTEHTDGTQTQGTKNNDVLNPMGLTFTRDHITEYYGNGGVNAGHNIDTDTLIENILGNIDPDQYLRTKYGK
jgi:hypothetical protein